MGAMPIECARCRPRCRSARKVDSATCNRRKLLSGVLAEFSLRPDLSECRSLLPDRAHTRANLGALSVFCKILDAWDGVTRDDLPCKRSSGTGEQRKAVPVTGGAPCEDSIKTHASN
jgi:hypothetical protein